MWFACLLFVILFHVSLAGCVQFLQYYYQSGCLYRLRALGERNQLDLTVGKHCDRFESWEKCWPGLCHRFTLHLAWSQSPDWSLMLLLQRAFNLGCGGGLLSSSRFYSLVMWVSALKCCLSFFMQYTKYTDPKHLNSVCVCIYVR